MTVETLPQSQTPLFYSNDLKEIELKGKRHLPLTDKGEWIIRFGHQGKPHRIARFDWVPQDREKQ